MDVKVLREKAAEEELKAGSAVGDIPVKAEAAVQMVLDYVANGPKPQPAEAKP